MMSEIPQWPIGAVHPDYGTVEMMAVLSGEPYRFFTDSDGVVSMIPLEFLEEDES
jgi:hypothetical protein